MDRVNPSVEQSIFSIFSIGHSSHKLETFIGLLREYGIQVLVDTRSYPYSKYAPHFDSSVLKETISNAGMKYLYLGRELGGRPDQLEYYDASGRVLYGKVAQTENFLEGIRRLESGLKAFKVAIMCSEENPSACHRRLLVGRVLSMRGVLLYHIRGNGTLQTEAELAAQEKNEVGIDSQFVLFSEQKEDQWKSTQSVLQRRKLQSSSGH